METSVLEQEKKAVKTPPCQFTVEEIKRRIIQAEIEIKQGRVIPHEAILRK
jgi:hypothetical protein